MIPSDPRNIIITNKTNWIERIFFENEFGKRIGYASLKPNEAISFKLTDHPILKSSFRINRIFNIWSVPQDTNPGEPDKQFRTIRDEEFIHTRHPIREIVFATISRTSLASKPLASLIGKELVLKELSYKTSTQVHPTIPYAKLKDVLRPL